MIDFKRICQDNSIPIIETGHHHCHDGWAQVHCPFCTDGRGGYHLGFNLNYGNFSCWRCGKLKPFKVLQAIFPTYTSKEIYDLINNNQIHKRGTIKKEATKRNKTIQPPRGTKPLQKQHKRYLIKRGFKPRLLEEEWGLLGTDYSAHNDWAWRIIIPITDRTGRIVSYQGRIITEGVKPKYKMSNKQKILIDQNTLLYGIDKVPKESVVIVEGVADVWRLGPGSVATFGIDWKKQQANILKNFKNCFIMFDCGDKNAAKRADELANFLSLYSRQVEVIEDFARGIKDPAELSTTQAKKIMQRLGF